MRTTHCKASREPPFDSRALRVYCHPGSLIARAIDKPGHIQSGRGTGPTTPRQPGARIAARNRPVPIPDFSEGEKDEGRRDTAFGPAPLASRGFFVRSTMKKDFRRALAYMENWPITVTQSPANSDAEFNQDIVVRFKASERGATAVINPRYVVKSTGAGAGSGT